MLERRISAPRASTSACSVSTAAERSMPRGSVESMRTSS
jgi:hypothetical protein